MEISKKSVGETLFAVALTVGAYFLITGFFWSFVQEADGIESFAWLLLWFASGAGAVWLAFAIIKVLLRCHSFKWLTILVGTIFVTLIWQTAQRDGWWMALLLYGSGCFATIWTLARFAYAEGLAEGASARQKEID